MAPKTPPWPADAVTRRKVADLIPYARNARTHSPAQIAQLVASIREWGWTMPVLIDEAGQIIAGHGRIMAASEMGLADVPTMTATGWSEAKKRAYVIADNKLTLNAGWDDDMLALEFADLKLADFDLALTGFGEMELADLMGDAGGSGEGPSPGGAGSLADRFGAVPFSVLSAREGPWQDRKRAWLALGIKSEEGRGAELIPNGGGQHQRNATPGGTLMPSADYSKNHARGDGKGRAIS